MYRVETNSNKAEVVEIWNSTILASLKMRSGFGCMPTKGIKAGRKIRNTVPQWCVISGRALRSSPKSSAEMFFFHWNAYEGTPLFCSLNQNLEVFLECFILLWHYRTTETRILTSHPVGLTISHHVWQPLLTMSRNTAENFDFPAFR